MASTKSTTSVKPVAGIYGEKGFGPAGSAGQATTVQVNPSGTVGQSGSGGGKK